MTPKKAVGVFYHNFYESVFNMGREKSNYWPRYTYFQADGGDLDCFLIGGDTIARVVDNYTLLTGRPALLPKRALGYQGSSMYYPELEKDSDDAVLGFVDTIKEEASPLMDSTCPAATPARTTSAVSLPGTPSASRTPVLTSMP